MSAVQDEESSPVNVDINVYVGLNFNSSQAHGQKTRGTSSQAHGQKTRGTDYAMTINGLTSHLVNCNCVILSTNIYSHHVTARYLISSGHSCTTVYIQNYF